MRTRAVSYHINKAVFEQAIINFPLRSYVEEDKAQKDISALHFQLSEIERKYNDLIE